VDILISETIHNRPKTRLAADEYVRFEALMAMTTF